jgi:hypothetical protein
VTAQLLFDGTFSTDAVASAGHTLVQRLHDEAMATIAALAENWDAPAPDAAPTEDDEPVTYADPATWSADDDDDQDAEDDGCRVLPVLQLPALLPQPRRATPNTTSPQTPAATAAAAVTDEFAVPAERELAAS